MTFPESLKPRLIFEDTHLIVLSKPAGLLSQGERRGDPCLVDWLRLYLGRPYVGLVHRLDRNTSGIMLVAKRTKAASRLTGQLQNGALARAYRAWLLGALPEGERRWSHFLVKDEARNRVSIARASQEKDAKPASLRLRAIARGSFRGRGLTLAELELETGRPHQIRAQAAAEGFPLLGDVKYGRAENQGLGFPRPALHSFRLSFEHPMTRERLVFEDPLSEDMRSINPRPLSRPPGESGP